LPSTIPAIESMSSATKYVIAFAIIFILLALFALVLRRLTGNRATLVGERGRTRQPRLGIVDVYDLDRQRQLILLRRDNVEHLLLVGGPNDVVVETNIVRVAGARLPAAAAEAIERLDDRTVEIAPMRPVVEPALARANEGAVAAHLGNLETAVASAALEQVAGPAAARPEPARSEPVQPAQRPAPPRAEPERPARPVVAAPAMPDVRAAPRPATAPLARTNPTPPQAAAQPSPGPEKPVFTDMAQQLEDALRRTPPAGQEPAHTPPPRDDQQPRRGANGNGRPEPVPASPPPAPPRPAEVRPAPRPQAPVQVVPPAPPAPAPAPMAAVQPTPSPAPRTEAGRDPFSIEDIEAEFARLLGRPLDKR
jgi:flagellar protein FliO/FliZ